MTNEVLEAELAKLNSKKVCLVRPMFGSQRDSCVGILWVLDKKYHLQFVVNGMSSDILFTTDDVSLIEPFSKEDDYLKVIRLKGPYDYKENYEKIKH